MNPPVASHRTAVRPLAQGLKESIGPISKSKLEIASQPLDTVVLCQKLNELKQKQEEEEKQDRFTRSLSDKLSSAQPRAFPTEDDDDQSILDQHMARVFSPYLSPGTISPKHLHRYQHRSNEMSTSMPDFGKSNAIEENNPNFFVFLTNNFNIVQLHKLCDIRNQFRSMHLLDCSVARRVN